MFSTVLSFPRYFLLTEEKIVILPATLQSLLGLRFHCHGSLNGGTATILRDSRYLKTPQRRAFQILSTTYWRGACSWIDQLS